MGDEWRDIHVNPFAASYQVIKRKKSLAANGGGANK
jgi:hypothetical protein